MQEQKVKVIFWRFSHSPVCLKFGMGQGKTLKDMLKPAHGSSSTVSQRVYLNLFFFCCVFLFVCVFVYLFAFETESRS